MASRAATMAVPDDLLMHGQKRRRDTAHAQYWGPDKTRMQQNDWDHDQRHASSQASKKLKSTAAIPPNFGASIGWTSGLPMMDLLTQQRPTQRPGSSHGQSIWTYQPPIAAQVSSSSEHIYMPAQQPTSTVRGHRRHQSVPSIPTFTPMHGTLGSIPEQAPDELDAFLDLDDPTYFYNEFEHVDDRLSLGEIVWTAPRPAYVALPSTYEVAEALARFPPPTPAQNAKQTISKYVTHDQTNTQAMYISIKQSAEWASIRDDPIFCDLSNILHSPPNRRPSIIDRLRPKTALQHSSAALHSDGNEIMIIRQAQDAMIKALNDGDVNDAKQDGSRGREREEMATSEVHATVEAPPTPSNQPRKSAHRRANSLNPQAHTFAKRSSHAHSASLHIQPAFDFRPAGDPKPALKGQHCRARSQSPKRNVAFALATDEADDTIQPLGGHARHASRPRSISPQRQPVVPEPKQFAVDAAQEDILAKLGVTGTAQKVYATPGPALNPNPGSASRSQSPEQRAFQFPPPSASIPQAQSRTLQAMQPLQEMSPNAISQGGQGWSGRKRGRAQSEDIDNNFKRARDLRTMHSAGGSGMRRR